MALDAMDTVSIVSWSLIDHACLLVAGMSGRVVSSEF
jgi:hypothetical protein